MNSTTNALEVDLSLPNEVTVEVAEELDRSTWSRVGDAPCASEIVRWRRTLKTIRDTLEDRKADQPLIRRVQVLIDLHELLDALPNGRCIEDGYKETIWSAVENKLLREQIESVVLYGGGKHTHWLIESGWPFSANTRILCIVDDHVSGEQIGGIPVIGPDEFVPGTESCVILPSSDAHEDLLLEAARPLAASHGLEFWGVYTDTELAESIDDDTQDPAHLPPSKILSCASTRINPAPEHRGSLGLKPEREWLSRFLEMPACVDWATGFMNDLDTAFSWDIIESSLRSAQDLFVTVEIGTASGVSTSRIAHALNLLCKPQWALHSFDIMDRCYFNKDRRVGSAILDLAGDLQDRIFVHTKQIATDAARSFPPHSVHLAIIDANHNHPAPSLDLLALLPALAPNAWVILHDIELELIMGMDKECPDTHVGPRLLFDAYPGVKLREERSNPIDSNTGAIQMPEDPISLRGFLIDLIRTRS